MFQKCSIKGLILLCSIALKKEYEQRNNILLVISLKQNINSKITVRKWTKNRRTKAEKNMFCRVIIYITIWTIRKHNWLAFISIENNFPRKKKRNDIICLEKSSQKGLTFPSKALSICIYITAINIITIQKINNKWKKESWS